jgi:hypothetical protein
MLGTLSKDESRRHPMVWLIVAEPEASRRQWWVDTLRCCRVVVVETPATRCEMRIATDPERSMQSGRANQWWSAYTRRTGDERVVADESPEAL